MAAVATAPGAKLRKARRVQAFMMFSEGVRKDV
jgi:hypothetical protein